MLHSCKTCSEKQYVVVFEETQICYVFGSIYKTGKDRIAIFFYLKNFYGNKTTENSFFSKAETFMAIEA